MPKRHNPRASARVTRIPQTLAGAALHRLAQHGQQRPLPRLAQQAIRHVVQRDPRAGLRLPAATRRQQVQRRGVRPLTAMRLEAHDGAALEDAATDAADDVLHAPHSTAHARTPPPFGLLRKRVPASRRPGQDAMTGADALMAPLAALATPVIDGDFGAV